MAVPTPEQIAEVRKGLESVGVVLEKIGTVAEGSTGKLTAGLNAVTASVLGTGRAFTNLAGTMGGAFSGISRAVDAFRPATARLFTYEVQNLNAAVGSVLVPVLERATSFLHRMNEVISSASPQARALMAGLAGVAASVTAASAAMPVLTAAFSAATGGVLPLLGLLVAAGAGLSVMGDGAGGLAGTLAGLAEAFRPVVAALAAAGERLLPQIAAVLPKLADAAATLAEALAPVLVIVIDVGASLVEAVLPALASMAPLAQTFARAIIAVTPFIETIGTVLKMIFSLFEKLLPLAVQFVNVLAEIMIPVFQPLLEALVYIINAIMTAITMAVVAWQNKGKLLSGIWDMSDVKKEADKIMESMRAGAPKLEGPRGVGLPGGKYTEAGSSASLMSVEALSRKLMVAGFSAGGTIAERQLDEAKKTTDLLREIRDETKAGAKGRPASSTPFEDARNPGRPFFPR